MGINLLSRNHAHLPENTYADLWQSIQRSGQLMPSCSGLEITNSQFSSQFGVFKPKKEFHLNSGIRVYFSNSWPLLWGWASESRKDQCTSWSETRTLHCEIVLADISTRHPTVHMAFKIARANINYTLHNLANQFCYELWACWAGPAPTEMTRLFVRPFCRQSGSTESTQVDKNRLNQQFGPWRCTFPGRSTGGTVGEYDVRDSYAGLTLVICCCKSSADENAGSCRVKSNCHVIGSTT